MKSDHPSASDGRRPDLETLKTLMAPYQRPCARRASWQIVNTLGSYTAVWVAMYFSAQLSWWLTVPLAVLAGALLVRVFIIFHDCGHGSTFRSKRANRFWGSVCGVLTFTPYFRWRWEHARHHATSGNLDRRGIGDIWTMTVREYLAASRWKRFAYRTVRNPLALFVVGPLLLMLVIERMPSSSGSARERRSVWWGNFAVLATAVSLGTLFGLVPYLIIQFIVLLTAGMAGIWLFYVQHQFRGAYWERSDEWDYVAAALDGSSYYRLPRVLQWFSGNIGFHHIHHLNPGIPNYRLQACHESHPVFRAVPAITLSTSLKSLSYRLWDESGKRLITYRQLREMRGNSSLA